MDMNIPELSSSSILKVLFLSVNIFFLLFLAQFFLLFYSSELAHQADTNHHNIPSMVLPLPVAVLKLLQELPSLTLKIRKLYQMLT